MTDERTAEANVDIGEVAKFGDLADEWWDESGSLRTLHAINPLRVDYINERAELDGARVLDVGCGAGILSEALARRGATVTGVDPAERSIAAAKAHAASSNLTIDYRVDSLAHIAASEAGAFDIVTCLELLEHVPDPEQTIAGCARAVRPGGTVFFSTINRNLKSFLLAIVTAEYALGMLPRGTHEYARLVRPSEVGRAARHCGLTVQDVTGLHHNPLTGRYWLGGNVDVNYLVCARRPEVG
ncbi:MAG: bifunctional 2-polyprenyl-6-hydroxyphenol methylase/3-demethylubiquinol 3-O-methyltransferase UbiG [Gammaproteobacteria bacterium]